MPSLTSAQLNTFVDGAWASVFPAVILIWKRVDLGPGFQFPCWILKQTMGTDYWNVQYFLVSLTRTARWGREKGGRERKGKKRGEKEAENKNIKRVRREEINCLWYNCPEPPAMTWRQHTGKASFYRTKWRRRQALKPPAFLNRRIHD